VRSLLVVSLRMALTAPASIVEAIGDHLRRFGLDDVVQMRSKFSASSEDHSVDDASGNLHRAIARASRNSQADNRVLAESVSVPKPTPEQRTMRRAALLRAMRLAVPLEVASKPYPENLVPLWSQEGLTLLEGSVGPFEKLSQCMIGQGPLQCGITSLTIALNVCRSPSDPFFTLAALHEELRCAVQPTRPFFSASLGEIGALSEVHAKGRVRIVYASDTTCNEFRSHAWGILASGGCVVANFKRSELGYASPFAGHCSPLAAYNPDTDEFLVMDVAQKSFQPVWVTCKTLFRGMHTMEKPRDERIPPTQTRGFILIESAVSDRHSQV